MLHETEMPRATRRRASLPGVTVAVAAFVGLGVLFASEKSERLSAAAVASRPAAERVQYGSSPGPGGAIHLTLAPGLSFVDDSSSNFPIRRENLTDGRIASDRPTVIFFGTSHCWNTNREAERFVELYRKEKDSARFLVVDLDHPSPDQKALVTRFYRGSIPTLAFLDRKGNVVYNRSGETWSTRGDSSALEEILQRTKRSD